MEGYFPKSGGPDQVDVVLETHASVGFLAHLAFNHFVLNVPYYREMYRLNDHGMFLSRMTLTNWLEKGAGFTKRLVEMFKNMAHARAKFVYAYEQGDDLNAKQMQEYIGWLYGQEDTYRQSGLTAEEITRQRNFLRTKEVIGRMRSFLNVLTSEGHPPRGDLMEKAVNYLKNF